MTDQPPKEPTMTTTERPPTVDEGLRLVADWLDEADRLINTLADARGIVHQNRGNDVQQDLRRLADWFTTHSEQARSAWRHVQNGPDPVIEAAR